MTAKTRVSQDDLVDIVMERLRRTKGCERVLNVVILPLEGETPSWDVDFVKDGEQPLSHIVRQQIRSLQLAYDCSENPPRKQTQPTSGKPKP